jgi:anti-anti-sigma factor
MDWHSEQRQNDLIAAPGSPINHINADKFEARLMASVGEASAKGLRLIIDFRSVAYMSSVGLRVLMRVLNEARKSPSGAHARAERGAKKLRRDADRQPGRHHARDLRDQQVR